MANRFWVPGGNGVWASITNWSATSGGSSGATAPTSSDAVSVNASSGTSPAITVSSSDCLSIDFTGAITPSIIFSGNLNIFGNATFISTITTSGSFGWNFASTSTGRTITWNGYVSTAITTFTGVGGGWTFQDAITHGATFSHTSGTLDTNSKACSFFVFQSTGALARVLNLGTSAITASSTWSINGSNLTVNAGTSEITLTSTGLFPAFGGLTWNNVTFNGAQSTLSDSSTFNIITIGAGKILRGSAGTNQTVNDIISNGSAGSLASLRSSTAGTPMTITKTSGTLAFNWMAIKDVTVTGGATFNAYNSTDSGGNTGINFLAGYAHKILGQLITKINGLLPTKVNKV